MISDPGCVIGIGELLWDDFGASRRPGGAPANVAFHARQLGLDAVLCSRVGQDRLGDELLQHLHDHGLPTKHIQRDTEHPTGTVRVDAGRPDHPVYLIRRNVAWDYIEYDESLSGLLEQARAICFGTLAQRSPATRRTIRRVLDVARRSLRVYDVNLRPPFFDRDTVIESLRQSDVVKLNGDELTIVADMVEVDGRDMADQAEALLRAFDLAVVCVTRGEQGCLLVSPTQRARIPGRRIEVVDTVGAGDACTAGLVYGLLADWPLEHTGTLANEVGALVAGHAGAMPLLEDGLATIRRRVSPSSRS